MTITYVTSEMAFLAIPVTKLECVSAATDEKSNGIGCDLCDGDSLQHSLVQSDWYKTCKLSDGLSTAYCSKINSVGAGFFYGYSNIPYIVVSCYQGAFTAETPLQPKKCPANDFLSLLTFMQRRFLNFSYTWFLLCLNHV